MLLSKQLYSLITEDNYIKYVKLYNRHGNPKQEIDDGAIGFILCCYYIDNHKDIFKMFKEFGYVRPEYLRDPDPYYAGISDFSKCIAISYRNFHSASREEQEFKNAEYIHDVISYNDISLDFINRWIEKDMIHLYIENFHDNIITKEQALSILRYNKEFQKIPYVEYEKAINTCNEL